MTLTIERVEFPFRYCPPGVATMGSPVDEPGRRDNERLHKVSLTQGFWILETLVTQAMWRAVMGNDPSEARGDDLPVEHISWYDCQAFLAKLNALNVAPDGLWFELPTEAQGEYAFRAGSDAPYHTGETLTSLDANIDDRVAGGGYLAHTTSVWRYRANAWGLRDVCGNVWEWRRDWFAEFPDVDAEDGVVDPTGPAEGEFKSLRGGSWHSTPSRCRIAFRHKDPPDHRHGYLGVRIALVADAG